MRSTLLEQIRKRRKQLGLKGIDMPMRTGINRQQYGLIEKAGNPNLETLDKIAEGLEAELMLIPKEHLRLVNNILMNPPASTAKANPNTPAESSRASRDFSNDTESGDFDDPWKIIEQVKGGQ